MSNGEKTLRAYVTRSAGVLNMPTDYTMRCIVGMVETGEIDGQIVRKVGGDQLAGIITNYAKRIGSAVTI